MKSINFSPQKHIFLWDLHEVILEKDMRTWIRICIQFDRKWELVRKLNKQSIVIFITFVLERLKITKKQMVSEELMQAARTTNNQAFVDLITTICSSYRPIDDTVKLMHQLSALGYKHHLGSNIGQTVFTDYHHKFASIIALFESYAIPFNRAAETIKKPHPDFFLTHVSKHNLQPNNFIFIDDRKANVNAALAVGMHAIHFKNPQQLRRELIRYNILK